MLKYLTYSLFAVVFSSELLAQKVMERSWNASGFERVSIRSDAVFEIRTSATATSEIRLRLKVSGEYSENVVLDISEEEKHLKVTTGYTPYFVMANDKLAAHKVMSMAIELTIPEHMILTVVSKLASFEGVGSFKKVDIHLYDGHCKLRSFMGDASISTKKGAVVVNAKEGVSGTGISRLGTVVNTLPSTGIYKIHAQSVNGDITLALDR